MYMYVRTMCYKGDWMCYGLINVNVAQKPSICASAKTLTNGHMHTPMWTQIQISRLEHMLMRTRHAQLRTQTRTQAHIDRHKRGHRHEPMNKKTHTHTIVDKDTY